MVVKVTLNLDSNWDEYKNTLFTEDFLKEDIGQVISDNLNGVELVNLKIVKG